MAEVEKTDIELYTGTEDSKLIFDFISKYKSFPNFYEEKLEEYSDNIAIVDEISNIKFTYRDLQEHTESFSKGLQALGVNKGDFVSIISENNGLWAVCDYSITRCGAITVARGSQAPLEELDYILSHSNSIGIICQNENLYKKIKPILDKKNLKFIILMFGESSEKDVYSFKDVIEKGKKHIFKKTELKSQDGYTVLYTSGTTGVPKGVFLSHANILSQMFSLSKAIPLDVGEKTIELSPAWHTGGRTLLYFHLISGMCVYFSSIANMKKDIIKYKVDRLDVVTRIWESIKETIFKTLKKDSFFVYLIFKFFINISMFYKSCISRIKNDKSIFVNYLLFFVLCPFHKLFSILCYKKIKEKFGINFKSSTTGSSLMSEKDCLFFGALDIELRDLYGLTEASPFISLTEGNLFESREQTLLLGTEVKIVDYETGLEVKNNQKGLIKIRGFQVMKGYYKNQTETSLVLDNDGWLNTGDFGSLTESNKLVIEGRLKETIVLSNGENVEPLPIEKVLLESKYIGQIILTGQDKKFLGALVVPSSEALKKFNIGKTDISDKIINNVKLRELIKHEIDANVIKKTNLKNFEKIKKFVILSEAFSSGNGTMSKTLKIKRNVVLEKYKKIIDEMYQ